MDISLQGEQFKKNILNEINEAQLPPIIVYYIIKDIYDITENSYRNYLNNIPTETENNNQK